MIFNVPLIADLQTPCLAGISLHFAVLDWRTAKVVSDFNVIFLAIQTISRAIVRTVLNCTLTHVCILVEEIPVMAVEALALAVLRVAVGDCWHASAVTCQCETLFACCAFAKVALAALVGACRHACE